MENVKETFNKKEGINNLSIKFYEGLRHDIFHEKNSEEIFQYIYNWIADIQ